VVQLSKSCPRNHPADLGPSRITTQAVGILGQSEPNGAAALFHCSRDSAIIDDLAANRTDSAYALEGFRPD
jgi:hypothetical protein